MEFQKSKNSKITTSIIMKFEKIRPPPNLPIKCLKDVVLKLHLFSFTLPQQGEKGDSGKGGED